MSNRRVVNKFPCNENGLIDRFIGTAFDIVKEVGEEIPNIRRLISLIDDFDNIISAGKDEIDASKEAALALIAVEVALAKKWATNPTNEVVEDGLYSAKHYAETASEITSTMSPISWHPQRVATDVTIPDKYNAWSFGPTMTISAGQSVTIGENAHWTIANGEVQ